MKQAEAVEIIEATLALMKERIAAGEMVKLKGFGVFAVTYKRARRGCNPYTGKEIVIGARHVVKFKPSQVLMDDINGK